MKIIRRHDCIMWPSKFDVLFRALESKCARLCTRNINKSIKSTGVCLMLVLIIQGNESTSNSNTTYKDSNTHTHSTHSRIHEPEIFYHTVFSARCSSNVKHIDLRKRQRKKKYQRWYSYSVTQNRKKIKCRWPTGTSSASLIAEISRFRSCWGTPPIVHIIFSQRTILLKSNFSTTVVHCLPVCTDRSSKSTINRKVVLKKFIFSGFLFFIEHRNSIDTNDTMHTVLIIE